MKTLASQAKAASAAFRAQVLDRITMGATLADDLVAELEGTRLVDVAQGVMQYVVRALFERACDIRMLATDRDIWSALQDPTPEALARAENRLRLIRRFSPFYSNALIADARGTMILSADRASPAVGKNVGDQPQFNRAIRSRSGDDWFTDEVWLNPWANNRAVLIFACAVRREGALEGEPVGILYLENDWEDRAGRAVRDVPSFSEADKQRTRVLIIDPACKIVASSDGAGFGTVFPLRQNGAERGVYVDGDQIVAHAQAKPFEGFDGLGLRCVVVQIAVSQTDIEAELRRDVAQRQAA